MPSSRESSRDRELVLKHQPSFSDSGRASVPMWDSSDPDRAPPPLPLNPATSSPITKANTSKNVAAAAEALTAKARESAYTINPPPSKSPEKSLIKGQTHKRLQSLQNGSLRDGNSYLNILGSLDRSPERSPERFPRISGLDLNTRSPERSPTRPETPSSSGRDGGRETPSGRSSRPPLKPILGENTPPSATMLALQNMSTPKESDPALADITNGSAHGFRNPHTIDALSTQILSLTTIATNLQREMAQLSRRSKDNATDLISLKEATNMRDEDIRKSLKDLVTNISSKILDPSNENGTRSSSGFRGNGSLLLDNKAYTSPSAAAKHPTFPRMASPSILGESELSTGTYNMEGTASIALLEKIWRDMGTKEGQEELVSLIAELKEIPKSKTTDTAVSKKMEEILSLVKNNLKDESPMSRALVPRRDNGNRVSSSATKPDGDMGLRPAPLATMSKDLSPKRDLPMPGNTMVQSIVGDDLQKLLKKMKDSISEGGGMTAEVKAHVRELRGEVLGMGRDIARRLDQTESAKGDDQNAQGPTREEIATIVDEGLGDLKIQLEALIREKRRQSSSSISSRRSIDGQEVYAAVKNALVDFPHEQQLANQQPHQGIERDEILEAVRGAWESYKPEIELQNFGLERDEILQCLQEGLKQYQPAEPAQAFGGATYDEVLEAVREGLQNFQPPAPLETEASLTREEILSCVRECLDSYEFPLPSVHPQDGEITRADVLEAVKEGLSAQPPMSREIGFNREDLFDAVKAGIEDVQTPMGGVGEKVMEKMEELIDDMRVEFKQYSVANGGDTEQVLDAMKDGFEVLRENIESYVDRMANVADKDTASVRGGDESKVTAKDEIIETFKHALEDLRADLDETMSRKPQGAAPTDNGALLDAMEKEFEHLRQTIATSMLRSGSNSIDREEILDTIREGLSTSNQSRSRDLDQDVGTSHGEIKEELEQLRQSLATTLIQSGGTADKEEIIEALRELQENLRVEINARSNRPESLNSSTGELLDALHDGLDTLRTDVQKMVNKPIDMTVNYDILETLKEGLADIRADVDRLAAEKPSQFSSNRDGEVVVADENAAGAYQSDISNLELMITQLRIKVEALDNMPPPQLSEDAASRYHIERLEQMIKEVQDAVGDIPRHEHAHQGTAMKEDIEALETLLRNTKAKMDDMTSSETEGFVKVHHIDTLEGLVIEARDAMAELASESLSSKDFGVLEAMLKEVRAGIEEIREKGPGAGGNDRALKSDIEALETLCMDTKTQIEELPLPDPESLATKNEIEGLAELVRGLNDQVTEGHTLSAQAFECRKTEHGGIGDKLEDVKLLFEDVRDELKSKMDDGHNSLKDLAEALESVAEAIAAGDVSSTVGDLREVVKKEFAAMNSNSDIAKEYHEQNHSMLLDQHAEHKDAVIKEVNVKLDARFDEIMTKYDDAQLAAQDKEASLETRGTEQANALTATKAVIEDLRLLVDTLGSTMTDSCDRMNEDSKTVYARVDEVSTKIDELLSADSKTEHQATRAEISKALAGVEGIHVQTSEYNPKILSAVYDILGLVGQHYEQAKQSTEEIKTSVQAIPGSIPLPAIAPSAPQAEMLREAPPVERYDDSHLQKKLDQLIDHASEAGKTVAGLAILEQIQQHTAKTSTMLADFVDAQKIVTIEAESVKAREAEEALVALEKRNAQKSVVEADIVRVSEQKEVLQSDVTTLIREKEEQATLKFRMQADLSSLETALQIRREELHIMEARADTLERRILDGILDHSRSLLSTSRPPSSLKDMNLKRVTSTSSNATAATRKTSGATAMPSTPTGAVSSGVGMALKRRQAPRSSGEVNKTDRRILSLSTLGGNKPANPERSMVFANPSASKAGSLAAGLKRSHSVKSNFPSRKSSWNGPKAVVPYGEEEYPEGDKENSILDEVDEEEGDGSDAGTERRTSYTGTDGRTSYTGTYTGTGSYGEGSIISSMNGDHRNSYGASTVGTIGTRDFAITDDGHSEDGHADPEGDDRVVVHQTQGEDERPRTSDSAYQESEMLVPQAQKGEVNNSSEVVLFGHPSDSGIGTDIPTAKLESHGQGSDYFKG